MDRKKMLGIVAWAFTAAAIAAAVYASVSHRGSAFAALLMTFALLLQYAYGREMKNKERRK